MTPDPTRRRVLQFTGAGATASLAGCSGMLSENESDELQADREPDIEPSEGVTAVVQPSQEELMGLQQEVRTEVEEGELSQQEAQAEMQERRGELYLSRAIELESAVADDDDLSVEAAIGEQGALLLTGSDEGLIGLLRGNEVDALLPGEDYEEALQAQESEAPEAQPEPEPDDANETESDGAEDNESDGSDDESADADGNESTDGDDSSD